MKKLLKITIIAIISVAVIICFPQKVLQPVSIGYTDPHEILPVTSEVEIENNNIDSDVIRVDETTAGNIDAASSVDQASIEEKPDTLTILAVGDIMAHKHNLQSAYDNKTKTYDFKGKFDYVKSYISEVDLAIANLETVTAGEKAQYTSFPLFNTPDSIVEALAYAGFDVLSTANNHCLDRGRDGLLRTIDIIKKNNMLHTGTAAETGTRYATIDVKEFKISILAYSYGFNGNIVKLNNDEQNYMVNSIDEKRIRQDITSAKDNGADIIIVCMHWGLEYHRKASNQQRNLAFKLYEWGADLIFGSHPHVIQETEMFHTQNRIGYAIYSMGNFLSNFRREDQGERMNKEYTEDGVMVKVELEKKKGSTDGNNIVIRKVTHIPTWIDKYMEDGKIVYKILSADNETMDEAFVNDRNKARLLESYRNTMELVKDY